MVDNKGGIFWIIRSCGIPRWRSSSTSMAKIVDFPQRRTPARTFTGGWPINGAMTRYRMALKPLDRPLLVSICIVDDYPAYSNAFLVYNKKSGVTGSLFVRQAILGHSFDQGDCTAKKFEILAGFPCNNEIGYIQVGFCLAHCKLSGKPCNN